MSRSRLSRAFLGLLLAAAALLVALLAGAPPLAAVLAVLGGAAAALVVARQAPEEPPTPSAPPPPPEGPKLPDLTDVISTVDQPLLIVRDRRVLIANEAAKALLGQHVENADIRLAIRHPAAAERLAAPAADPAPPIELVGLGGQDRRWEMATAPLPDGSLIIRLRDRSEAHAAEQMRVDFVANASHELRTPLATLLGFIETLQDDAAGDDRKTRARFLGIMEGEARRMRQLVDDLMSLSRIEAERFTLPREAVDLRPLVDEAAGNLAPLLERKGARVAVEQAADATVVAGDRPQLLQLVTNLVENAVRYGRAGTLVTVRLDAAGEDMLRLSVIDQGEGIAPEHIPHLTRRFYRADPGRSRAQGGTGLGLAIVKHIVERHRGRLDIRSTLGEGTTVQVWLPRAAEPPSQKSHSTVTGVTPSRPSDDSSSH